CCHATRRLPTAPSSSESSPHWMTPKNSLQQILIASAAFSNGSSSSQPGRYSQSSHRIRQPPPTVPTISRRNDMVVSLTKMPSRASALRGRDSPLSVSEFHYVNGNRIIPPFPAALDIAAF